VEKVATPPGAQGAVLSLGFLEKGNTPINKHALGSGNIIKSI